MGRGAAYRDDQGLTKGKWTPEEDRILVKHIEKHGCGSWTTLPKHAGLLRCGRSCRLRWKNYLNPDIKRGPFTFEDQKLIVQLQARLGNRWSTIATHLPGRTDNDIKNLWNIRLKKRSLLDLDPTTNQDSILSLGLANQAPADLPTTGVMSQWEPEARLPGYPMPFTPCVKEETDNFFDIWNSETVESFTTTLAPWDESTGCLIPFSQTAASSSSALLKSSTNSCGSKEVAMASCSSPCTKDADDDSSDSALQLLLDSPLIGGDDDMTFLEEKSDGNTQSPAVGF